MKTAMILLTCALAGCARIHPLVKYSHLSDITERNDVSQDYIGVGVAVEYQWGSIDVSQGLKAYGCDDGTYVCEMHSGTEVSVRWVGHR